MEALQPVDRELRRINAVTLEQLAVSTEFREFWASTLKGIESFRLNEAVLLHLSSARKRAGTVLEVNAQAAIDMWRLEGGMELWDMLLYTLIPQLRTTEETEAETAADYNGDL